MKKKKSTLLNVVSILLIIFSTFGILGGIITLATYDAITSALESMGMAAIPMWSYVVSLIMSCIDMAAGIMGVMYRSRKSVMIIGAVYVLSVIATIVFNIVTTGFSAAYILNLILPVLYVWGWYQSE